MIRVCFVFSLRLCPRAKYQPYDALRQRFWREYLKQYDTDDTGAISHLELTSMLDSLASTLSHETVNSFWSRFNKRSHDDTLTIDEAVQCLETELCRPTSEKKRINPGDDAMIDTSAPVTPGFFGGMESQQSALNLDKLDFSGVSNGQGRDLHPDDARIHPGAPLQHPTESNQHPIGEVAPGSGSPTQSTMRTPFKRDPSASSSTSDVCTCIYLLAWYLLVRACRLVFTYSLGIY